MSKLTVTYYWHSLQLYVNLCRLVEVQFFSNVDFFFFSFFPSLVFGKSQLFYPGVIVPSAAAQNSSWEMMFSLQEYNFSGHRRPGNMAPWHCGGEGDRVVL